MRHLALVLVPVIAVAGCTARALPPDTASSEVVLRAYLDALVAGDCTATAAMELPSMHVGNGELCGGVDVTAYRGIRGPGGVPGIEEVFHVTLTTGGDGGRSIEAGDLGWFLGLKREAGGPWRLSGGGSGP
jgi:hypothetical protein